MMRKIIYVFIFVMLLSSYVAAQPSSYDWRNVDGVNYVTSVKDQGDCSTCWAFASTAALESKAIMAGILSVSSADLSEQVLINYNGYGTCYGGTSGTAANYIRNYGLPFESCFPYYEATCCTAAGPCSTFQTRTYRISSWNYVGVPVTDPTVADIKSAIYNYGPVVIDFKMYTDFTSYESGVYYYNFLGWYPAPTYTGKHIVLAVGYNDAGSYFIVKNSWGESFGESGYFKIAYSEVGGTTDFGNTTVRYGTASGPAAPNPPSNLRIIP